MIGKSSTILKEVIKIIYNYYNLKEYIEFKYQDIFKQESITIIDAYSKYNAISGDEIFWTKIFANELKIGDYVRLLNFQLSPWFPRKPGIYWTQTAKEAREKAFRSRVAKIENGVIVFDRYGKNLMVELGGIGSVNFRKDRDNILVTATCSGNTDQGVPILMSREIWNKIQNEYKSYKKIEVDLEGIIGLVPLEFDTLLFRNSGMQKIVFQVNSILNVKSKISDLNINVTPWTIFEIPNRNEPFGFTYATHNLYKGDIKSSVDWIKNYVYDNKGNLIVTDFDEEMNYLDAQFPLNKCMSNVIDEKEILRYLQNIKKNHS